MDNYAAKEHRVRTFEVLCSWGFRGLQDENKNERTRFLKVCPRCQCDDSKNYSPFWATAPTSRER